MGNRRFCGYSDGCIAVGSFLAADRYLGMMNLTLLSVVTAFLIFYLPSRAVTVHLLFTGSALAVMGVLAWRQHPDDSFGVVSRFGIAALVLVSLPAFLHRHQTTLRHAVRTQFELARHDPLTGLLNRRGFDALLADAVGRRQHLARIVLIVLDLDAFKTVNDRFGHARGDEVLVTVADRLVRALDGSGTAVRTGGEEFAVVVDGVAAPRDPAAALALGDRIRAVVSCDSDEVPVTVSVGVAFCTGVLDTNQVQTILDAADRAMYEAKRAGGNRVALGEVVGC